MKRQDNMYSLTLKYKTMKKVSVFVIMLITACTATFAQVGDHKHGSPHGGTVKSSGKEFHIEFTLKDGMMMAYLLDDKEKTMKTDGVTASALIQTADGQTSTITLIPSGKEGFTYTLDKTKKYNKAIVNMVISGKTASATFDLTVKKEEDGHKHQH